jgi:hypothetical protein
MPALGQNRFPSAGFDFDGQRNGPPRAVGRLVVSEKFRHNRVASLVRLWDALY